MRCTSRLLHLALRTRDLLTQLLLQLFKVLSLVFSNALAQALIDAGGLS